MIRRLSLTALLLASGLPALANPDSEARRLPTSTQVFASGRMLPPGHETAKLIRRLQANPAVDWLLRQLPFPVPADAADQMIGWVDGRVTFAWVRTDEHSTIDDFRRRDAQAPVYAEIERKLGYIGAEVEKFRKRYKRMPKSWQEMVALKLRKTVPEYEHAEFVLVQSPPMVTVRYRGDLKLEEYAETPHWTPADGVHSGQIKPYHALNLVLALRTVDDAQARTQITRLLGAPAEPDRWTVTPDKSYSPWQVRLSSGWLVAADNPAVLDGFLATAAADPAAASLESNPRYQFQRRQLPLSSQEGKTFVFVDLEDIFSTTHSLGAVPPAGQACKSLGFVYSDTAANTSILPTEGWVEGMLQIASPANATWTAGNVTDFSFANDISADSQTVYAVNLPAAVRLLTTMADWDQTSAAMVNELWTQFQTATGITTSLAETSQKFGWGVLESDALDEFVGEMGSIFGPGGEEEASSLLKYLSRSSGSYTVQVFDPTVADTLAGTLWKATGEAAQTETVGSTRYWMRPDRSWAVASLPQKLLASSRLSRRLMLRSLDTLAVPGSGLTRHSSLDQFRSQVRGEMLVFTSQKMDWLYSIMKGLLLLFDGTTRPEAEVLGRYRDSYAAITLDPQGLRFYSAFYSETPVRPVPTTPANPDIAQLRQKLAGAFETAPTPANATSEGETTNGGMLAEHQARQQYTGCMSNLKNLATALEMYASDNAGLYPNSLARLTADKQMLYLRQIPTCPAAGKDTYSAHYKFSRKPDHFSLYCWGHHHKAVQVPANRPAYNAEMGLIPK